jgi:hypothetical protein
MNVDLHDEHSTTDASTDLPETNEKVTLFFNFIIKYLKISSWAALRPPVATKKQQGRQKKNN